MTAGLLPRNAKSLGWKPELLNEAGGCARRAPRLTPNDISGGTTDGHANAGRSTPPRSPAGTTYLSQHTARKQHTANNSPHPHSGDGAKDGGSLSPSCILSPEQPIDGMRPFLAEVIPMRPLVDIPCLKLPTEGGEGGDGLRDNTRALDSQIGQHNMRASETAMARPGSDAARRFSHDGSMLNRPLPPGKCWRVGGFAATNAINTLHTGFFYVACYMVQSCTCH